MTGVDVVSAAPASSSRERGSSARSRAAWPANGDFDTDPFPGRPRVLFVGATDSTHTHSWIDLLAGEALNVRLFGLPGGIPPDAWPVRTYVTSHTERPLDARTRRRLYSAKPVARYPKRAYARLVGTGPVLERRWLARVIRQWKPDIVHTLGIDPAGEFYFDARRELGMPRGAGPRWLLQLRGGSDLALAQHDEARASRVGEVMRACDCLLGDNLVNFEIARGLGVREEQLSPIGVVPGTGGVDIGEIASYAAGPPSTRRTIVWPKAYECPWSKALPVFEALTQCWDRMPPCEIHMLAMIPETRMWFYALPPAVKRACRIDERIPRRDMLELMGRARVMLAPSLVDGTPNSLFEAMAAGALPLVSPLDTIRPLVAHEQNVLFARNLYPGEIADALVRAMTDDALVDRAAERNIARVRELADRDRIRPRVLDLYAALAAARSQ